MNPIKRTIEDLVLDDSFCNYCFGTNEEDILFWETYIEINPDEKSTLVAARAMVLQLRSAVQHQTITKPTRLSHVFRIAAIFMVVFGSFLVYKWLLPGNTDSLAELQTKDTSHASFIVYKTAPGERKKIILPDSSVVELNVASRLQLTKGFNSSNRNLYLEGEAFFDVTHNEKLPFVVQTSSYEVRVLGTIFNIKAYPDELTSETSLISGKVKLYKADGGHLTLLPLQKVVFENKTVSENILKNDSTPGFGVQHIMPVIKNKEGTVNEIAWVDNTLQFQNESFLEIKTKLERWYNVRIEWKDSLIGSYRFTGTFQNESIEQVLEALQFSYPFNYSIEKNTIVLSK